jgi:ComF family protein
VRAARLMDLPGGRAPHRLLGAPRRLLSRALACVAGAGACLPQQCALCAAGSGRRLVCDACTMDLPQLPELCPACALPCPHGALCGACLARPPAFSRTRAAFEYAFPIDRLLQGLKYEGRLWLAEFLAGALAGRVDTWPDALVPLPLAPARQRQRGYNQAREIARWLAHRGPAPVLDGLVRTRETPSQANLPWSARAANVRGAFAGRASLSGLRIAIVDDVMTTGATLRAAAIAARRAGARDVEAWVVARTLRSA